MFDRYITLMKKLHVDWLSNRHQFSPIKYYSPHTHYVGVVFVARELPPGGTIEAVCPDPRGAHARA